MSVSNLATALTVIFVVFVIALIAELLYVLWRRRSFRRHTSPPPPPPITDAAAKELLYFFCLKPNTQVDPPGTPNTNTNTEGLSPDDQVVDVFKLLEAKGPSRFLCTIKEEDRDSVESTPEVEFSNKKTTAEEEEEVAMTTEFSTPCDSPLFFTPAGSPSRDFMESRFVVCVNESETVMPDDPRP